MATKEQTQEALQYINTPVEANVEDDDISWKIVDQDDQIICHGILMPGVAFMIRDLINERTEQ